MGYLILLIKWREVMKGIEEWRKRLKKINEYIIEIINDMKNKKKGREREKGR